MVVNAPALMAHIIMPGISIATGIGIVTTAIVIGVIVSQQIASFQNTVVVLQSPATIILNRFIEPNELPLFYDVLETMDVFLEDVKQVLRTKFGEQFVNVELTEFSPTPSVTSNSAKKSQHIYKVITPDYCTVSIIISNCTKTSEEYNCVNTTIPSVKCTDPTMDVLDCVRKTIPLGKCQAAEPDTRICNDSTIIIQSIVLIKQRTIRLL